MVWKRTDVNVQILYLIRANDLSAGIWIGLVKPSGSNDVLRQKNCGGVTVSGKVNNKEESSPQCVYIDVFAPNTQSDNLFASSCVEPRSYMCLGSTATGMICYL